MDESWGQALDHFARHLREDDKPRRASTIKGYRAQLETLATLAPAGPWSVTPDVVTEWLIGRGGSKPHSWAAARTFYSWGVARGRMHASPVPPSGRGRPGRQVQPRAVMPPLWHEPIDAWVASMESVGQPLRSIEVRLRYVRDLSQRFPDPWNVTGDGIARWMADHAWAPETRKSARGAIRGFYRYAVTSGRIDSSPGDALGSVRVPRAVPRPIAQPALLDALEGATDRDTLLVLLGAYAGLRAAEIAAVRPVTDMEGGFLYVKGKGGHTRRVPLHPVVVQAIGEELTRRRAGRLGTGFRWVGTIDADGYLFPSPGGGHVTAGAVVAQLGKVLPGRWTAHTLRHRFASAAYAATRDLRAVQELLGHASPATTARYTAMPDDALRAAVMGIA